MHATSEEEEVEFDCYLSNCPRCLYYELGCFLTLNGAIDIKISSVIAFFLLKCAMKTTNWVVAHTLLIKIRFVNLGFIKPILIDCMAYLE